MTINRRRVLTGVAAGLGLALLQPRRAQGADRVDVVVAGGGLAGLNAALLLQDAGASVLVLEAGARVGGRVYTDDRVADGTELGAVEVGPFYARVRNLANRFDLALEPRGDPVGAFALAIQGQLIDMADWPLSPLNKTVGDERRIPPPALLQNFVTRHNPLKNPDDWLQPGARALDVSVHEWLEDQGLSADGLRLVNEGLITADSRATSILPSLQDALRLQLAGSLAGDLPSGGVAKFVGGTSRLPEAMASELGDRLRLDHRVRRIEMDASGVVTHCDNGRIYRSDFVVVAVPFPALRHIEVKPDFAGVQAEAIRDMRWANTSQVYLRHRAGAYWDTDGVAPSLWSDGPVNLYRQVRGTDLVIAVLVGRKADALDALAPAERGAFVVRDLEALRPSLRGKLEVVASHSWRLEADIGGCRHDFRPGNVTRFVPAMFRPHERMHFAGEHTRLAEIGMESALESGERAALEIFSA